MKFVAASFLIAVASCFFIFAEAQIITTLKPTTACSCGPTTLTSFSTSTLKSSTSKPTATQKTTERTTPTWRPTSPTNTFKTSTSKPTNATTSKPTTTLKATQRTTPTNRTTSRPTSRTTTPKTSSTKGTTPTKPTNGTTSKPTSRTTTLKTSTGRTIPTKPTNETRSTTLPPVDKICFANESYCNIKTCNPPSVNTLCQYSPSTWGAACQPGYPTASTVGSTDIAIILKVHNAYRQRVAQGLETLGSPAGPQPLASNMRELKWDDELACMAAAWAHQCVYKRDACRDVSRFLVGQNIYISASSADNLGTSDWNEAVTAWYDEVQDMNPADVPYFRSNPPPFIGHYTQVVWANTYLVGCAVAYYKITTTVYGPKPYNRFYVCNYGPAGNWIGSPVYNQGSAGSACPAGPSSSYTGLCA